MKKDGLAERLTVDLLLFVVASAGMGLMRLLTGSFELTVIGGIAWIISQIWQTEHAAKKEGAP